MDQQRKFAKHSLGYQRTDGSPAKFVVSIDVKLVAEISSLKCSNFYVNETKCLKELSEDPSPQTGYCGHIFCSGCAENLTETFVDVQKQGKKKSFKVSNFSPAVDISLYHCDACKDYVNLRRGADEEIFQLFSENKLLKYFFKALEDPGYYCKRCGDGRHPFHNSVYCEMCRNQDKKYKDERYKKYTCVIHAIKHIEFGCDVKIMAKAGVGEYVREEHPSENATADDPHLKSIDRSRTQVLASLFHCAQCHNRLDQHVGNSDRFQLECGHLIGSGCVDVVWKNMRQGLEVVCIFCSAETVSDKYFIFPSKTLPKIVSKYAAPFECSGRCNALHSLDYQAPSPPSHPKICAWCYIENFLENKTNKQNSRLSIKK